MNEVPAPQLRKGALEIAVLALVAAGERDAGVYGGALVEELGHFPSLAAKQGTVYPLLSRLRQHGLVSTTWQESPSGPPRRYYRLTEAGRARLTSQQDTWRSLAQDMSRILDAAPTTRPTKKGGLR